jgi:dTDP-4-amino-4,6-dideoxygalactose transaminase
VTLIPPLDLSQQYQSIRAEVEAEVAQILASGRYINGPIVQAFEQQFARYIGTSECVACNSGTDALYLALRALKIGAGDEVITTPFTFFATAETISAVGATPVFIDVDADTFNFDVALIEAAITPRTKAIMPVHLFGQPVDMTRVMAIAQAHNLYVIEDCAQCAGASWGEAKVGSIGHMGCFSFYPTKNLGACGDGGAITTADPELAHRMRLLREHGQPRQYIHDAIGINSRLDVIQAAILQIKLRYLEQWNAQRQGVAERYEALLGGLADIVTPKPLAGGTHVWNQYTIRVLSAAAEAEPGARRDRLRTHLREQGVLTSLYYPVPMHRQPVYESLGYAAEQLPVANRLAAEVLSLPMYPELTAQQQQQVLFTLKDCLLQTV